MTYKFVENLTSDVMFEAYGKDLKELFESAASAMFDVICKRELVKEKDKIEVEAEAESLEELMIAWLQQLIALVDTEEMFFKRFEIKEINERKLKAVCYGGPMTPEKGETVVKAVTYYKFKLEKNKKGYKATICLDI